MVKIEVRKEVLESLNGKTVIITGGANGIGKTTSRLFHDYGANVVIGDLDDKGGAALAQEFGRQGNKTDIFHSSSETRLTLLQRSGLFKKIDVTNWISLRELSEASVATFGSIDCVRANADIPEQSDFQLEDRLDDEGKLAEPKFKLIDVNVNGVLRSTYLYG